MTLEEKLTQYARDTGTEIYEYPLPCVSSVALKMGEGMYIGIDRAKLTAERERAVHLAHELGHCATDSFYCIYSPLVTRDRLERRASVWAIEHTIPKKALERAIESGTREEWELAELFEVTEEFMHAALEYYKNGELYLDIK